MASVWKRLQRVNKRAAKFQYTASYHRIDLETSAKWKPTKLCIVWTRRSRRVVTEPADWEPSLKDPLKGCVIYAMPENRSVAVTLFKDSRTNELEDKDWTFVLEDVSPTGKRRRLASSAINMRKYASLESSSRSLVVPLDPLTQKIVSATVHLTLHCVLLREGHAYDEDMQSLASLLSVNNNSDIAVLEDLEEDEYSMSDNSARHMLDFRQQMEEMTNSLTNSDVAATPNSVQSLNFDNSRTPTAPITPATPNDQDVTPKNELPPSKSREYLTNLTKLAMRTELPKFTSTPVKNTTPSPEIKVENQKGFVFKTKHLSKHSLKPLEFKTNLNDIGLDRRDHNGSKEGTPVEDLTPIGDVEKLFPHRLDKDKTPVQDLLEWCQEVTAEYRQCKVSNLTTSWRNGIAFCAIIHHFRPDLIDFSGLQPEDAEINLRVAFEASSRLGISQVLTAADICAKPVPDRLAIMTHLFQVRAHFTGNELQVEQLGMDPDESSYLVGRHDTDGSIPRDLFSREVIERRSIRQNNFTPLKESQESRSSLSPEKCQSPTQIRDRLLSHSKQVLKALSPARDKVADNGDRNTRWFTDPVAVEPPPHRPEKLMTRKELTDPFASDEEEEQNEPKDVKIGSPKSPSEQEVPSDVTPDRNTSPVKTPVELPKPAPQLLSRHDELKERARQLLEATKKEARDKERIKRQKEKEENSMKNDIVNGGLHNGEISPKKMSEADRQAALRERARQLIANARAGIVSPTSPSRPGRGTVEIISRQSVLDEIAAAGGVEQLESMLADEEANRSPRSRNGSLSPSRSMGEPHDDKKSIHSVDSSPGDGVRSPLHSFSALVNRLTPDKDGEDEAIPEGASYIASEMEALEREQSAIDQRAAALEKELRRVMEGADNTERKWRKLLVLCAKVPHPMEEDRLMSQWFNLVNKKNALLRRQMQLNILEQEEDLSHRCELLARELRLSLAVDEWRKTTGQKRRERLLLQELLSAVNERDRLVQEMDEQERAIANDDEIQRKLTEVEIQRKNNCILQ